MSFLLNFKLTLYGHPGGDIELCDLSNEIDRVIDHFSPPNKALLAEVIYGVEHNFDLVRK
ncbi:hypothetical protein VYA_44310 (plasmid) [Vibrio alfacsensis]|nr:hypothetical protein VYA_44310 [Vibrio alfacsensis]